MKVSLIAAGLASITSVAARPRERCCFKLAASGGARGTLTQISGGQNRIGAGFSPASYCIWNGIITDSYGRVCVLTETFENPTQFICTSEPKHERDFTITGAGHLEHAGGTGFYACPASVSEWNIYTTPLTGFAFKCVPITLSTSGMCAAYG